MAAGLRNVRRSAALLLASLVLLKAAAPVTARAASSADVAKEHDLAAAARAGKWADVLERLASLKKDSAERGPPG